jgi:TonB family protein
MVRHRRRWAFVGEIVVVSALALLAAMPSTAAASQIAVPARVLERSEPVYPPAARAAGVSGDVRFRALIDASGKPESIEILSVPQSGLGFEDAVRASVSQWRFSPATLRGEPTSAVYEGAVRFELTLRGEAILAASSGDAWTAVRALLQQLKVPIDKADETNQLLITRQVPREALKLPDSVLVDVPDGYRPGGLVFHVYVTPGMEPARVAVGTVMDLSSGWRGRPQLTVYATDAIAQWFVVELAQRMNVRFEPLSASPETRAGQARSLMPAGLTDACATRPAQLARLSKPGEASTGVSVPKPVSEVKAIFPADQLPGRKSTFVTFHGEITEHGTLINPRMTSPDDASPSFVTAAQLAFGLWRFRPARLGNCPVRVDATFSHFFMVK